MHGDIQKLAGMVYPEVAEFVCHGRGQTLRGGDNARNARLELISGHSIAWIDVNGCNGTSMAAMWPTFGFAEHAGRTDGISAVDNFWWGGDGAVAHPSSKLIKSDVI
jgi:hypothetical protein